jgi:hypothetical protein
VTASGPRPSRACPRRRRALLGLLVLVLAALAPACALPQDAAPRVVPADEVPYDLSGAAQVDAPAFDPALELQPITVYLIGATAGGERLLVPRQRMIPDPVNLVTVVGNLMAGGVTPDERALGLVNQVPGRDLRSVERGTTPGGIDRATATIEVQPQFFDRFPTTEAQRLAIGQIVLTVTGYRAPGGEAPVEQVRFAVGGRVRPVPTADPVNPILPVVRAAHFATLQGTTPAASGRA